MKEESEIRRPNEELASVAEITISKAKELILQSIPNDEIVSMYIKGSYVQKEMQPNSDVDIVVILKTEQYLPAVYELTEQYGESVTPPFQAVVYTMKELQTGERASNRTRNTTTISIFVKQMEYLPLIYGTKPEGPLFTRTDKKDLTAYLGVFRKTFMAELKEGKLSFKGLVKLTLWLIERAERAGGNPITYYSWQKLADSIKDPNHIIHTTLRLRRQEQKATESEQAIFLEQLEDYLQSLEKTYNTK
jgi:predicted nucleotidyltransferase